MGFGVPVSERNGDISTTIRRARLYPTSYIAVTEEVTGTCTVCRLYVHVDRFRMAIRPEWIESFANASEGHDSRRKPKKHRSISTLCINYRTFSLRSTPMAPAITIKTGSGIFFVLVSMTNVTKAMRIVGKSISERRERM